MVRWNSSIHGKVLRSLFESGIADPRFSKAADIDPIKELREEFKQFTPQTFRTNYKSSATNWMAGKSVEGMRFKSLSFDKQDEQEPEEGQEDSDEESEEFEEEMLPPPAKKMTAAPKTFTKAVHSGVYKYKDDEKKWDPIFHSCKFISNGYRREELIVEPPASFDGAEGTYQVSFENNNTVLVIKIAPNMALSDPHDINAYYSQKYGIVTAKDSARDQAFKESAKSITDKWYTYRHPLDWAGKPSDDMGAMPWLDFADIVSHGRVFPLLIVNLSSISPIEEKPKKMTGGLTRNTFKSPPKIKGVDMAGDKTAQMAAMLEDMFMSGTMTPEMKRKFRDFGLGEHDMDLRDDHGDKDGEKHAKKHNPGVLIGSNATVA